MLGLMKARRMMMMKVSNRERKKLLLLNGEEGEESGAPQRERREHPVEEIMRIAELPAKRRSPFEIDVLHDALSNVSIFSKISKQGMHSLTKDVKLRVLRPGEILCEQGDKGDVMWIIVQGSLEAWQDGRPAPLPHGPKDTPPTANKEATGMRPEDLPRSPSVSVDDSARESLPAHAPSKARPMKLTRHATITGSGMNAAMRSGDVGALVHTATPIEPGYSGELALLQGMSSRACTMRAGLPEGYDSSSVVLESTLQTVLLEVTRQQFENTAVQLVNQQTSAKMKCLRSCAALKGLPEAQLAKLAYYMTETTMPAHSTLARKGARVETLYIIAQGECKCLDRPSPPKSSSSKGPHGTVSAGVSRRPRSRKAGHRAAMATRGTGVAGVPPPLQPPVRLSTPRGNNTPRGVEIAKLGPGQLVGDIEMVAMGTGGSKPVTWRHSYVTTGPFVCFSVKPQDLERRILSDSTMTRQLHSEIALKQAWRSARGENEYVNPAVVVSANGDYMLPTESDADKPDFWNPVARKEPKGMTLGHLKKVALELDASQLATKQLAAEAGVSVRAAQLLVPTPPEGAKGKASGKKRQGLADRYGGSFISLQPSDLSVAGMSEQEMGNAKQTEESNLEVAEPEQQHVEERHPRFAQAMSQQASVASLGASAAPPPPPLFPAVSYASLPSAASSQSPIGRSQSARGPLGMSSGSICMDGHSKSPWGGSRTERRCPFFLESPQAIQSAKKKSKDAPSSYPRTYGARTARPARAPRFPPVGPALPGLMPVASRK